MIKDRIRYVRKYAKLTQTEFGKKIGVSLSAIQNLEYGRVEPNDLTILMLCRTFHVNEHWLRTGEGEMFAARSLDQELVALAEALMQESSESFRKRFIAALLQLPQEFWPELEKFVEALRKGGTP